MTPDVPIPKLSTAGSRVLVVEGDPETSALVAYHLARAAHRLRTAGDAPEALRTLAAEPTDLAVLGTLLPGTSPLDLLQALRRSPATHDLPVILLSPGAAADERERALSLGADDCLSCPFSPVELLLRIEAVLRRLRGVSEPPVVGMILRRGPVTVDCARLRVEVEGRRVELSTTEIRLLIVLMERAGRVCGRDHLLREVWQPGPGITDRAVDMHVQRLRRKLGSPGAAIETVRGFGYRFAGAAPAGE